MCPSECARVSVPVWGVCLGGWGCAQALGSRGGAAEGVASARQANGLEPFRERRRRSLPEFAAPTK